MALAPLAAEMHRTATTEIELAEKAGRHEDDADGHHRLKTFAADAAEFSEQVQAIETSKELTPLGVAARIKTVAERHVLTAEKLDQQAAAFERRESTSAEAAWVAEIALPTGNNLLFALQLIEARRDLAAMSDIDQDLLLRSPGPAGRLARQAAYAWPSLREKPWGLPGTAAAARAGVAERADVAVTGFRAIELRGLARRYRSMIGLAEAPRVVGRPGGA